MGRGRLAGKALAVLRWSRGGRVGFGVHLIALVVKCESLGCHESPAQRNQVNGMGCFSGGDVRPLIQLAGCQETSGTEWEALQSA